MAQTNLPMLSRTGSHMFWDSSWDNSFVFNRELINSLFLKKFFELVFVDNILNCSIFKAKLFLKNKKTPGFLELKKFSYTSDKNYKSKKLISKVLTSKLWLLKYQGWLVLTIFIYKPKHTRLFKKFSSIRRGTSKRSRSATLRCLYYNFFCFTKNKQVFKKFEKIEKTFD